MSPTAFAADPAAALLRLLGEAPALAARLGALPPWVLGLLAALGALALLFGARRRRPVAAIGGAAMGWLAALAAAGALQLSSNWGPWGAAVLGTAALALPSAFPFAAGGLLGALAGALLPVPGQGPLAASIGLFLLGGFGVLAARPIAALAAGTAGAAVLAAAAAGASRHLPWLAPLAERPTLLWALFVVLAVTGTAFQARDAWPTAAPRRGAGGAELPPSGGAEASPRPTPAG